MDSTILAETQAFVSKQREALQQQREALCNQQHELQRRLDEVNEMLRKFDVFEGQAAPARQQSRTTLAIGADDLLRTENTQVPVSQPHSSANRPTFQRGRGDWIQYRQILGLTPDQEVDLHFGQRDPWIPYESAMAEVEQIVRDHLELAQRTGLEYLMFRHGQSTSRRGKTTSRSIVRQFMRSKNATPLIERRHCIQHDTVFVAKVRPTRLSRPSDCE